MDVSDFLRCEITIVDTKIVHYITCIVYNIDIPNLFIHPSSIGQSFDLLLKIFTSVQGGDVIFKTQGSIKAVKISSYLWNTMTTVTGTHPMLATSSRNHFGMKSTFPSIASTYRQKTTNSSFIVYLATFEY